MNGDGREGVRARAREGTGVMRDRERVSGWGAGGWAPIAPILELEPPLEDLRGRRCEPAEVGGYATVTAGSLTLAPPTWWFFRSDADDEPSERGHLDARGTLLVNFLRGQGPTTHRHLQGGAVSAGALRSQPDPPAGSHESTCALQPFGTQEKTPTRLFRVVNLDVHAAILLGAPCRDREHNDFAFFRVRRYILV